MVQVRAFDAFFRVVVAPWTPCRLESYSFSALTSESLPQPALTSLAGRTQSGGADGERNERYQKKHQRRQKSRL